MRIRNMRTNHLTRPMGVMMDEPLFTWTTDETDALHQKSARVRVWEAGVCVWDSGEGNLSSLGVKAPIALKPRTRYTWRVEVAADNGDCAQSDEEWFETGKRDEPWTGEWIAAPFERSVHPVLIRNFELPGKPVRARAYICGLGLYELRVNGMEATDEVLAPFCNDYRLWIQSQTLDVTDCLRQGSNRLEVWLGAGWYKGRYAWKDNIVDIFGDRMQLMMELRCEMPDGSEFVLGTDGQWRAARSPVLDSNIYDGEIYDARLEAGLGDPAGWAPCVAVDAPQGPLTDRLSPPVRRCDCLPVREVLTTPKGETVLDFGQLLTGWVEMDLDLPEGARVVLQHGELLQNDCFYNENLRTAKARYEYISAGHPAHVRPHFTFYGFRFVKVEGIDPASLRPEQFAAHVIHSDLSRIGHIETSNPKVNQLISNAWWGQIGNFLDVPTDCPQRDERMGWTGDAHVFAPTASFNQYTPAFYAKYLHDMLLEQEELDGSVPHVVPDFLDQIERRMHMDHLFAGDQGEYGSCVWGDAATGIPWTLYTFFGDKDLLAEQYRNMKAWTDWIRTQDETRCGGSRLWTCGFHFADWLALDNPEQGSSFGGTDPYCVASAFYYYSADLTARAAKALGYDADEKEYRKLAEEVREAFRKEYITRTGRVAERTQTAMVLALALRLCEEADRPRIIADLRRKLKDRSWHLDTGFTGTYFLPRTLSENGMHDVACTLLLNEDYPSWLYEVNMGATTVWERWNSVLPNGLVSDTGMNSMNHYAYGSVVEWMYRCLCGLNPVEDAPGFRKARIAPMSDPRLSHVRAEYDSASGRYVSGWERDDQRVTYCVTVPFDCEASFVPETAQGRWTVDGQARDAKECWTLGPGDHTIVREL